MSIDLTPSIARLRAEATTLDERIGEATEQLIRLFTARRALSVSISTLEELCGVVPATSETSETSEEDLYDVKVTRREVAEDVAAKASADVGEAAESAAPEVAPDVVAEPAPPPVAPAEAEPAPGRPVETVVASEGDEPPFRAVRCGVEPVSLRAFRKLRKDGPMHAAELALALGLPKGNAWTLLNARKDAFKHMTDGRWDVADRWRQGQGATTT